MLSVRGNRFESPRSYTPSSIPVDSRDDARLNLDESASRRTSPTLAPAAPHHVQTYWTPLFISSSVFDCRLTYRVPFSPSLDSIRAAKFFFRASGSFRSAADGFAKLAMSG